MFHIEDWAGNILTAHGEFKTFEDTWGYIYSNFEEEDFQELYAIEND